MSLEILSQASITLISASLSLVGGLALLLTYVKIPIFQTSVHRLLVFLTIADILTAFGYIIGTVNFLTLNDDQRNTTDPMCEAQSFITTFSSLSSFGWTSVIAIHLYLLIRSHRNFEKDRLVKAWYFTIGWIFPATITTVVLAIKKLGRDTHGQQAGTGLWCWIKLDYKDNRIHSSDIRLMFISGKLWEILTYVLSFSVYMLLKITTFLERQRNSNYSWGRVKGTDLRDEDERFCFTWLILYLLRLWGTIRFFFAISGDGSNQKITNADNILKYFHCAGDCAQALGNFLLFCVFDKNIRKKYGEIFCRYRYDRNQNVLLNTSESTNYQTTFRIRRKENDAM